MNPYDYNRDNVVDGADIAVARDGATTFLTTLQLINIPTSPPDESARLDWVFAIVGGPTRKFSLPATANILSSSHKQGTEETEGEILRGVMMPLQFRAESNLPHYYRDASGLDNIIDKIAIEIAELKPFEKRLFGKICG